MPSNDEPFVSAGFPCKDCGHRFWELKRLRRHIGKKLCPKVYGKRVRAPAHAEPAEPVGEPGFGDPADFDVNNLLRQLPADLDAFLEGQPVFSEPALVEPFNVGAVLGE